MNAAVAAALAAALAAPVLSGAHVGLLAVDADTGAPIAAYNADDSFVPASTMKLLVGSAALARLDPSFAYVTSLETTGAISGGTLNGDLVLRGGGDAALRAADLDAAAAAVAAAGVTRVTGTLYTDATRYDDERYPPGWSWDDLPYDYAAPVSALSLEENAVSVYVAPGDAPGAPARLRYGPATGAFTIENDAVTGARDSGDTIDAVRPWDRPTTIRIVGSRALGAPEADDVDVAVPDGPSFAGDVLARSLAAHGVTLAGGVAPAGAPRPGQKLWTHRSPTLPALLAAFWQPSDNLMGELLLKELGTGDGGAPGSDARGIAVERAWLRAIGVAPESVGIADGSGLSYYDRITPRALVAILTADWHGAHRQVVLDALPEAGVRGTLKHRFAGTPLQGTLFAKTGTVDRARTLAGFLRASNGKNVAFALLINDWMDDGRPNADRDLDAVRKTLLEKLEER